LQGAGAHELGDVLAVTAFSAMDHFAQRNSERKAGRDGCGDVDHQNLQQWRHGHDLVVGRFGSLLMVVYSLLMVDVSCRIITALRPQVRS